MTSRRKQPLRFLVSTAILVGCSSGFSSTSHLLHHRQSQSRSASQPSSQQLLLDDSAHSVLAMCNSRRSGHTRHHNVLLPGLPMDLSRASRLRLFSSRYGDFGSNDDFDDESDNDPFMASLRNRMMEVTDRDTKIPLVVLDSMLPRQVLKIKVNNDLFINLVKSRLEEETPCFGILGIARLTTGEQVHLTSGVEVQIVGKPVNHERGGILLELKAGRRFALQGEVATANHGWTEGRVKFLSSAEQEQDEETGSRSLEERMALVRAIQKTRAFTSPNMNIDGGKSLVDQWILLAKERERKPGQIDQLLQDLGSIPPVEEPSERAFWVGALINPIPAMGVALEIRPALLTAKTAEERTQVALDGILRSIKHMDGSAPLW